MQRNFYTDDFEQLMRQKADQYKMYPSDHVWKGVHKALHGRRRWYWTGLAVLLVGAGLFTAGYLLNKQTINPLVSRLQPSLTATQEAKTAQQISLAESNSSEIKLQNPAPERIIGRELFLLQSSPVGYTLPFVSTTFARKEAMMHENAMMQSPRLKNEYSLALKQNNVSVEFADAASESAQKPEQQLNWLQEYAVYKLTATKQKRIGWMLHFSPTMNYRKLTGGGTLYAPTSEIQSVPMAASFNGAVDQYVHHRPALGFELGSSFLYRTSKHVQFKAGIQFNYSRYNIEAFSTHPEKATIALNPYWNGDTIVSYTSVRNMSGYAQQEIANQYFELSLPVGVEVRLFGNEKLQLNVAGTVQPTYLLNRNSYLITTDYKNYTKEPSLVRRWNINAGVETYVAYNTGTVRWQLGPQFRYQLLSSYVNEYPIKEYLMEYGFKIGVSKTIR